MSLSLCVLRKCAVPAIETGRRQLGIFYDRFAKKITSNVTLSSKLNCFFLYFLVQNVCRFWFDAPSSGCRRLDDESSVTRALSSSFFFSSCSVGKPHLSRRTRPSIIIDREITCERSAARKCFDGKDITYARNGSSLLSVSIRLVKLLSSSHFFFLSSSSCVRLTWLPSSVFVVPFAILGVTDRNALFLKKNARDDGKK